MFPFKTKLQRNILTYSFSHPGKEYYVRELASLIGEDAGNVSRELRRLEKAGLYTSRIKGKSKFYILNKDYPLYSELKGMIFKTEGVAGSLKNILAEFPQISLALIHGSYAKNREKGSSDVDLIVVGKLSTEKFTQKIRKLESKINREINFSSLTKKEFDQALREKGSFIHTVVRDKIYILKGKFNAAETH